jgi:monoterpene epsilon-lactone hydrolase
MSTLIETLHRLQDSERPVEQAVLAAIGAHFASFTGSIRDAYDSMTEQTPMAAGIDMEIVDDASVQGWWVRPATAPTDRAILFIHGGAYMLGSAKAYRGFASQIAARTGVATFVLDYPLAPEHPFPAAPDAAAAALQWLLSQDFGRVALVGDSAGGALALAALDADQPDMPVLSSVVVFSPWIDLTLSGPSFLDPATHDPIFKPAILAAAVEKYLAGADPKNGRASPLFAIPENLPPLAIQVGTDELLLDDARRYAKAAAASGGDVRLDIYQGLHHVFQRSTDELPSARKALDAAAQFLSDHW